MCRWADSFKTFAKTHDWYNNGRSAFCDGCVSQTLVFWLIASRLFELGHKHPSGNMMTSSLFSGGNGGVENISPDLIRLHFVPLTSYSFFVIFVFYYSVINFTYLFAL